MSWHFKKKIILLISAMLGLHCSSGFCLAVASGDYCLVVVRARLLMVAPLIVRHGLQGAWASVLALCGLSGRGSQTLGHRIICCVCAMKASPASSTNKKCRCHQRLLASSVNEASPNFIQGLLPHPTVIAEELGECKENKETGFAPDR